VEIRPFALERYFGKHEFTAKLLLSSSDCESLSLAELLDWSGPEADRLWRELRLSYTQGPGHPLLRAEIAGSYREAKPAGVVVAAPEEAIFVAMHALLAPGDHVVVATPTYQSLVELPRTIGCRVTPWPLRLGEGGWGVDLDALDAAVGERTRMIVINFPNNPTGCQLARGELDRVVELARARGAWLLSDEMYRLLEHSEPDRLPAACDVYERGISLSGLSKAYGLPGLRIGWLATADPALPERFLAVKDYTTICSSAPSEVLAIMALQARHALLERALKIVRSNLMAARYFFGQQAGALAWIDARAGSVAFPRWTGPGTVEALCEAALAAHGLMIVPGSLFDWPGGHFRVGLGRKDLPAALALLAEVLREHCVKP
jgi:aspartate/methionine/tyrosine aminotransferase